MLLLAIVCVLPLKSEAAFTTGNLFVVNEPSSGSAGYDYILEFSQEGTNLRTIVPQSQSILGMTRLAYDKVSGHLFYSVSVWDTKTFVIREIDDTGMLVRTYTHPDFGSGNISMAFDPAGNLHIANDGYTYRKMANSTTIEKRFQLPYTGIGDLEIDSKGSLYLSDPFVNNAVYKIFPNGSIITFVDSADGIKNPYGMAMDKNDNLYVANSSYPNGAIMKVSPAGNSSVFAKIEPGILDMTFDANQILYVSNRSMATIHKFNDSGVGTLFANAANGLNDPSGLAFIINANACTTDSDGDSDVDGADLFSFATAYEAGCLEAFAADFGRNE